MDSVSTSICSWKSTRTLSLPNNSMASVNYFERIYADICMVIFSNSFMVHLTCTRTCMQSCGAAVRILMRVMIRSDELRCSSTRFLTNTDTKEKYNTIFHISTTIFLSHAHTTHFLSYAHTRTRTRTYLLIIMSDSELFGAKRIDLFGVSTTGTGTDTV